MPPTAPHLPAEGGVPAAKLAAVAAAAAHAPAAVTSRKESATAASAVAAGLAARLERAAATRVHGRWVLLDDFMALHPGGPVALSLAAGRDATVLFESYHPLASRQTMAAFLDKYAAAPDEAAYLEQRYAREMQSGSSDFDFRHAAGALEAARAGRGAAPAPRGADAFEAEVKDIARRYFDAEARRRGVSLRQAQKATPRRWLEITALGAAFAVSAAALVAGWWPALLLCPVLCWLWMVNFWCVARAGWLAARSRGRTAAVAPRARAPTVTPPARPRPLLPARPRAAGTTRRTLRSPRTGASTWRPRTLRPGSARRSCGRTSTRSATTCTPTSPGATRTCTTRPRCGASRTRSAGGWSTAGRW
jgi:hypothetical protein